MDRAALAGFLRARRDQLRPHDVGLTAGARRRTTGLRREEVAALASMSTDYYKRLEQRRGPQPSEQMLTALAQALRMSNDERDYLFQVAGRSPSRTSVEQQHVAPALVRVLDRLADTPALVISELGEVLIQNRMAAALFGDTTTYTGWARSDIYRWFTRSHERSHYPEDDRDRQSRALVAQLRAAFGSRGPSSRAAELVQLLLTSSEEFARLWDRHEVVRRYADHKVLIHPELGPIEVDCQALFTEDQSQTLLVLTAPPHTEAYAKLRSLAGSADECRHRQSPIAGVSRPSR